MDRSDALSLIREQNSTEIWQAAVQFSAALRTFRTVNLGKKISNYPVIGALPSADFVYGEDVGDPDAMKPVTTMDWGNRQLIAEEIAGIALIPENVVADAEPDFDLWAEIRPRIAEAVGARLDRACFFGTPGSTSPTTWPKGIALAAITAGNAVTEGTSIPEGASAANDLAADINAAIALVEDDGYDPATMYARRSIAGRVRGLRDANNAPIFVQTLDQAGRLVPSIYQVPTEYVRNGAWDASVASAIVGDPNYAILGIRQDLTFKFLDQASVTVLVGDTPTLVSLAENDLLGLRFKMRVGFQTAQTATLEGGASAYPFAVLEPAGS